MNETTPRKTPTGGDLGIASLLATIEQNLLLILGLPLMAMIGGAIYILTSNPTYDVDAQLMLRYGRELRAPITTGVGAEAQQVAPVVKRLEDATAESQLLSDPAILRQTVFELGEDFFLSEPPATTRLQKIKRALKKALSDVKNALRGALVRARLIPELTELERIAIWLESALEVELVTNSEVIRLHLPYPDPDYGVSLLNRMIGNYLERRRQTYLGGEETALLEARLDAARAELRAASARLNAMREREGLWSAEAQRADLVARLNAAAAKAGAARLREAALAARAGAAGAVLARAPTQVQGLVTMRRNPALDDIERQLTTLSVERIEAAARFGDASPEAREIDAQLAHLRKRRDAAAPRVDDQIAQRPNPTRDQALMIARETEIALAETRAEADALETERGRIGAELRALDRAGLALLELEQETLRAERQVASFSGALDEARITEATRAARISNIVVLAPPSASIAPSAPRFGRTMLISALGGLVLAGGLVLLIDALGARIRSNRDLRRIAPEAQVFGFDHVRRP